MLDPFKDYYSIYISISFINNGCFWRIKNVQKLRTTTTPQNKKEIKDWLSSKLPNTRLTELYNNLGNSRNIFSDIKQLKIKFF